MFSNLDKSDVLQSQLAKALETILETPRQAEKHLGQKKLRGPSNISKVLLPVSFWKHYPEAEKFIQHHFKSETRRAVISQIYVSDFNEGGDGPVTQAVMAAVTGVSKENFCKVAGELHKQRYITKKHQGARVYCHIGKKFFDELEKFLKKQRGEGKVD